MACLHPNKLTVFPDKSHILTSGKDSRVLFGQWIDYVNEDGEMTQLFEVPCGKCSECIKDRKQRWTNRLICEADCYDLHSVYFVTLTIDDDHLDEFRSRSGVPSLRKEAVQSWIKRLRDFLERGDNKKVYYGDPVRIRYFLSGEYGDRTLRPHYHCILFGVDLLGFSPSTQVGKNEQGQILYTSDVISYTWKYGNNCVARFSPATAAYTCGYCVKKLTGERSCEYDHFGIEREFALMSRRPGIAQNWFLKHADEIIENGTYILPFSDGVLLRPDRYALRTVFQDPVVQSRFKIRKRDMMLNRLESIDRCSGTRAEVLLRNAAEAKAQQFVNSKKIF